jgi:hypothetical protein
MPSSDFQAALSFGRLLSHREREGGREGGRDRRTEGEGRTKREYLSDVIVARGGGGRRHWVGKDSCNLEMHVRMYVCVCIHIMYVCTYVYTYTHTCVYVSLSLSLSLSLSITDRKVA